MGKPGGQAIPTFAQRPTAQSGDSGPRVWLSALRREMVMRRVESSILAPNSSWSTSAPDAYWRSRRAALDGHELVAE